MSKEEHIPKKFGRPPKYQGDETCWQAYLVLSGGASKEALAAALDVTPRTLDNWTEQHPEFAEAVTKGANEFIAKDHERLKDIVENPNKYRGLKPEFYKMYIDAHHKSGWWRPESQEKRNITVNGDINTIQNIADISTQELLKSSEKIIKQLGSLVGDDEESAEETTRRDS